MPCRGFTQGALLFLIAAATWGQSLDLGIFPTIETPPELGITHYRYKKEGPVITAVALAADGRTVATLTFEWPGDQTGRVRASTPEGRDISLIWYLATGKFEVIDHQTDRHVALSFDWDNKRWLAEGTTESSEEFATREYRLLSLLAGAYADAVSNLGLSPEVQEMAEPAPGTNEAPSEPPNLCEWPLRVAPL